MGVGETTLGALGLYGSSRALVGELRLGFGSKALVIDDALLDTYVVESLAPVAQRNMFVASSAESNVIRQRVLGNIAKSKAARESSNFSNWAFTNDPSRLPGLPSVAFEARLPSSMYPGTAARLDFREANNQLLAALDDASFAAGMERLIPRLHNQLVRPRSISTMPPAG